MRLEYTMHGGLPDGSRLIFRSHFKMGGIMADKNMTADDKLDLLVKEVALINQSITNKKELCPYREDIHDGVLAKTDVGKLASTVNGKLDDIRKDIGTVKERVTDNRISIKSWGALIAGSGSFAAVLIKVADRFI